MTRTAWLGLFLTISLLLLTGTAALGADFFFKDGDTVVIMGDSITERHLYSNYVEMWTLSRFPAWKITFHNVGIDGDRSVGGDSRFARDVLAYKPTALTVNFGMNDGGYGGFNQNYFNAYVTGLKGIAEKARAARLRVAFITPSPLEKKENGPAMEGYNRTLEKFSEGMKTTANAYGFLFVDQLHPCAAVLDKARTANPNNRIGGGDDVHFGPPGQALMAGEILKGLNFPPLVAAVEIDAATGKVTKAQNCKVTGAVAENGGLKFTQLDSALPFFPEESAKILEWSPVLEDMNKYTLKVTGLKAGKYDVKLGDIVIAQFSEAELAAGVNLAAAALKTGPIAEQVNSIWTAVKDKDKFNHEQIFRGLILANSKDVAEIAKRQAEVAKMDADLQKLRVIKPHAVEISPAK